MNKLGALVAGLLLFVGSAYADEVPADYEMDDSAAEVMEEVAGDASEAYADDAGSADSADAYAADSYGADDYAADDSGDDAAEEDEGEPLEFYIGGDYVWTSVSFSKEAYRTDFGADELDSNMYRFRGGVRLFNKIGLEAHIGAGDSDTDGLDADEYSTSQFYGVYIVPTGVLLDLIEVGGAIGYASTKLERPGVSETLSGASFGVNFEIPLFTSEGLELRVGGGGTMYRAQNSARISGYHAGVRVDFRI